MKRIKECGHRLLETDPGTAKSVGVTRAHRRMFATAQMTIISPKLAGGGKGWACTPPVKSAGCFPATITLTMHAPATTARVRVERHAEAR